MDQPRRGKIAHLPKDLREQLNQRLADNLPSDEILAWLNARPVVRKLLHKKFAGQEISPQNLSAWRQGGFADWERAQEIRERVRVSLEEAGEICAEVEHSETGRGSLLDRVGDRMALALWQLFREAEQSPPGSARTREMLQIVRELARLRRSDQQHQNTAILQERWEDHQKKFPYVPSTYVPGRLPRPLI